MGGKVGEKGEEDGKVVGLKCNIFLMVVYLATVRLYDYLGLWEREFLCAYRWLFKQR